LEALLTTLEAVFLGALQGMAEFLPISSSTHLQIIAQVFKIQEADTGFFIFLHAATALSIITYFFSSVISMPSKKNYLKCLLLASLPLVGIAFNKAFFLKAFSFSFLPIIGFSLTAIFLIATDYLPSRKSELNSWSSIFIGWMQALAIFPGISRSGMTIFAGTACGILAKETVAFSLFLGAIASLGAFALELAEGYEAFALTFPILLAFFSAYIAGLYSIRLLLWLVEKRQLKWIGCYLLFLAALKGYYL